MKDLHKVKVFFYINNKTQPSMKILKTNDFIAERIQLQPITNAELDVAKDNIDKVKEYDPKTWKVGDIAYTSWGYSMTLVDFYRLTKIIGKATFEFEKLDDKIVSGSYNSPAGCEVVPDESRAIGTVRGRIGKNGRVKIDGHTLFFWKGKPVYANHCD